jgi:predicted phosphodiesterase
VIAVLYDVHGNLGALEAVLADAEAAGAREFVLGGDYALFGPQPAETVERLRGLNARWVRGNGERWTADPGDAPDDDVVQGAIAAARAELGPAAVDELAALPERLETPHALFVHGSPVSDVRSFLPEPGDDEDELLAPAADADRLVFGHTHLQFRRRAATGTKLVNPGSVGMPFDGDPRSAYALIGHDGELELRRVPYDHAAAAAAVRDRFPGFGATIARRIETASFAPAG